MANEVSERIKLMNPGSLDEWYGPYASISAANSAVPASVRSGKVVLIGNVEYWWINNTSDPGLVPKSSGAVDLSVFIFNEIPAGLINGSNAIFISANPFKPESVVVKSNGLTLKPVDEYSLSNNNRIQLTFSPLVGELILIDYIKL